MIIEDEELRTLFKAESEEYFQRMDEGLLALESNPLDEGVLEALFRHAHNLKGAARMLGVGDIEKVAHVFEDALGAARRKEVALTSATIDRMCSSISGLRGLAESAVTGGVAGIGADQIIQLLEGRSVPVSEEPDSGVAPIEIPSVQTDSYTIDTIRVDPQKLDALMAQVTELAIARTRVAHRVAQADQILEILDESRRHPEKAASVDVSELLQRLRDNIHEDSDRLEVVTARLDAGVRAVRLMPLSSIFNMFPRMVRDIAREHGKEVRLVVEGGRIAADKRTLEEMKDPLMHMVRNAIDHGIEAPAEREAHGKARSATIRMTATQKGSNVVIEIADDGRGLDWDKIGRTALERKLVSREDLGRMTHMDIQSLIFMPGFSTSRVVTDLSGRGIGMDVVRTNVIRLKGSIFVESTPGAGCSFKVQLPATLATSHILLASVDGQTFGLPLEYVHSTRSLMSEDLFCLDGSKSTMVDGRPVSVVGLCDLLEMRGERTLSTPQSKSRTCIVLAAGEDLVAVTIDALLDEQEVILKPLEGLLKRVRNVSGFAILVTGEVCTVLNPLDLIRSASRGVVQTRGVSEERPSAVKPLILLVEDSITTRTWEKRGLEAAGFEVVTAVDGIEGLLRLTQHSFDAIVSDIEMPNMDGFTLTERVRQQEKFRELPVVLVTSLASDADKKRGIDAGASAYIVKASFDQNVLAETLRRLI